MILALKHLFKNSIVYGLANSIQKLVPFVILPVITNHLGKGALKTYDIAFIYAYLFCSLMLLSLDTAASVFFFDKKKNNFDKGQVLAYALILQCVSIGFNFLLIYPFREEIGHYMFSGDSLIRTYWQLAMLIIPGYMAFNYGLSVLLWYHRKRSYLFLCLLNTLLTIGSTVMAVRFFNGNLKALFLSQIGALSFCGLLAVWMIRKEIYAVLFPVNTMLVQKLLWFGLPFALTSFFRQLIPSVDRYFLLHYRYDNELPQYILAVKIASFFTIFSNAFVLAFTPYSLNKLNQDDAEMEISELFRFISIFALVSIPVLLLFREQLVLFFADRSYMLAARLLPFLFFGWVFDLFAYFSMLGIYKSQRSATILTILISGTTMISLLNMLLVPKYGVFGAALSFGLTKFLMFFFTLVYLKRYFRVRIHLPVFFVVFILVGIYSYLAYSVSLTLYLLLLVPLFASIFFYVRKSFAVYNWRQVFAWSRAR